MQVGPVSLLLVRAGEVRKTQRQMGPGQPPFFSDAITLRENHDDLHVPDKVQAGNIYLFGSRALKQEKEEIERMPAWIDDPKDKMLPPPNASYSS